MEELENVVPPVGGELSLPLFEQSAVAVPNTEPVILPVTINEPDIFT